MCSLEMESDNWRFRQLLASQLGTLAAVGISRPVQQSSQIKLSSVYHYWTGFNSNGLTQVQLFDSILVKFII
jgi:hypothetical protein